MSDVTEAMLKAGVEALEDTSPDTPEAFVTMIYTAMHEASPVQEGDLVEQIVVALHGEILAIEQESGGEGAPISELTDEQRKMLRRLARVSAAIVQERMDLLRDQTLLVDRLCSAVDQATEDIGHESIEGLLGQIGPLNERCIGLLGGRAALASAIKDEVR